MSIEKNFEEQFASFIGSGQTTDTDVETLTEPSAESAETVYEPTTAQATETVSQEPTTTNEPTTTITQTPEIPTVDYNKFLEESSNGMFKTVDDFKSSLTKLGEYETVVKERDEYKGKAEANPYANDLVKQFNELSKKGATPSQIDAFFKVNQIGELTELDPFQVRLNKMVLVDGVSPDTAERMIKREFGLNIDLDDELLTPEEKAEREIELKDAKESLRLASKSDLEVLQQYKANLTTPANIPDPKEIELQQQALLNNHITQIKPLAQNMAQTLSGIGTVKFGENSDEKLDFNFSQEYQATVAEKIQNYLAQDISPITEEKIREAAEYVAADYKVTHFDSAVKSAFEHGLNLGMERKSSEYHNANGLQTSSTQPNSEVDNTYRHLQAIASGQD